MITIALSKGRIFKDTLPLLKAAGIEVPTYVQYGGADMGFTGKDTLLEQGTHLGGTASGAGLYQPLDLQIAKCRVSVVVRSDFDYKSAVKKGSHLTGATKYAAISCEFFSSKGVHVDLIKLYGSMVLAPLVGLADAIVDHGAHAPRFVALASRARNKDKG